MSATDIEWATDTWNPTTGCDRVSPGCGMPRWPGDEPHGQCYALTMARRLKGMGSAKYQHDGDPGTSGPGFGITEHPDTLDAPLRWRQPRQVFVNSMSDLFHAGVSDTFIARVFAVMAMAPQHTFQVLTKRHGRMRSLLNRERWRDEMARHVDELIGDGETPTHIRHVEIREGWWPLRNVWLGVSVEDQQRADLRIPALIDTPAAVRFLSCEPLLGTVDLSRWIGCLHETITDDDLCMGCGADTTCVDRDDARGYLWPLHWVIAGGESGPGARPMHPDWARCLRDRCVTAGVPFFFKQHGQWGPVDDHRQWLHGARWINGDGRFVEVDKPHELTDNQAAGLQLMQSSRQGKKAAGRELDGRTWDQYPAGRP